MAYEVFDKVAHGTARRRPLSVTLTPSGSIRLNAAATQVIVALRADRIQIWWDADIRSMALRPVSEGAAIGSYALCRRGVDKSFHFYGGALLRHVAWPLPCSIALPIVWNETDRWFEVSLQGVGGSLHKRKKAR